MKAIVSLLTKFKKSLNKDLHFAATLENFSKTGNPVPYLEKLKHFKLSIM